MEKIAIVVDTTADLSEKFIKENNIKVLPFKIIYKDREYRDSYEISSDQVYKSLGEEVPTTSLPSLEEIEGVYEKLRDDGYTHVIGVTISSQLSGINNAIRLVSENYPDIKSYIFDSKSISEGEGFLVKQIVGMIRDNKSYDEIVERLPQLRKDIDVFFIIGTLEYLVKGGRIGKVAGTIGELLNLKPIIKINDEGVYDTYNKVRGRKKSIKKMCEYAKTELEKGNGIVIGHGDAEEESLKLINDLKAYSEEIGKGSVEFIGSISPVSGVHSGPGLIGCAIITK